MSQVKHAVSCLAITVTCFVVVYAGMYVRLHWPTAPWVVEGKVATASAHLRIVDTALNTYFLDNQKLPATSKHWDLLIPTHVSSKLDDPFAKGNDRAVQFYTSGTDFMIYSVGPNGQLDLRLPANFKVSPDNIADKIYDVTNGTVSSGDIVRFGSVVK